MSKYEQIRKYFRRSFPECNTDRQKEIGNIEEKLGDMEGKSNIHLIRVPKGEEGESGTEAMLKEIMTKDVPEMNKNLM